jgi:3-methyladenine DNA glycosylase/8-oxoguanine DNA glycosylase
MRLGFTLPLRCGPFSLERTVLSHGWWQVPPFAWDGQRLSVAFRPEEAPWRMDVRQDGDRLEVELLARARREPPGVRDLAARLLERALQLDWDLSEFYALCRRYEPLRGVPESGAGRVLRGLTLFDDVAVALCGTNIQWLQAVRLVRRLAELGPEAPGALRCFPRPGEIASAGEAHLRETVRMGYRSPSLVRLCGIPLDLPPGDGEELRRYFRALPGIGPVTARFLATLYRRADELAIDSLVLRYLGDKYHGGRKPAEQEVRERYARFGRYQALAYWFEFLGDVNPDTWRGWKEGRRE